MEIDPRDHKYYVENPDVNFNPVRNMAIVEETMREADRFHNPPAPGIENELGNRIEAVSAYACYRFNRGDKTIKEYLGESTYKKLVGEHILEKVRVMKALNGFNNNKKFSNAILL